MADVMQLARELGAALQADERYIALQEARKKNDSDEELQNLIGELNLLVMRYNKEMEKSDSVKDEEKMEELNKEYMTLYNTIMGNPNMLAYTKAQAQMEQVANQVNAIIAMSLNGENPMTCDPEANCTHDCSTCGGCH